MTRPVSALIIMDGFGLRAESAHNAVAMAGTPNLTHLAARFPHATLGASGMDVGLPEGQMGNSEVGHLNIGAGRVIYQELTRISKSIADGDFYANPVLCEACDKAKTGGGKLHLIGLLSDGGVHSHIEHLIALIDLAKQRGLPDVYVHCLMDGRDVPPSSGIGYVRQLEAAMQARGFGAIATIVGRYYAMDRDKRWDRVQQAWEAIAYGEGVQETSPVAAMENAYARGETDEFIKPIVLTKAGRPEATLQAGDSVVFFNFRPDRTRELTLAAIDEGFDGFVRKGGYIPLHFVSMTQYDATFRGIHIAFPPQPPLRNTLAEYLSSLGKRQLHIAETEKYAHVTFFFNGGIEAPYEGEDRALIPSPKVATYDLKPEMSAYEVTQESLRRIQSGAYDVIILNFANCDMVGHTAVEASVVQAVKAVDECVGQVVDALLKTGGRALVFADHGNAEMLVDPHTGEPFTAHTTNRVPFIVCDEAAAGKSVRDGKLADVAPTLLQLMGLPVPPEMTGDILIK